LWLVRESLDKTNQKEKTNSDDSDVELGLGWGQGGSGPGGEDELLCNICFHTRTIKVGEWC